jgi:hypothetical protein
MATRIEISNRGVSENLYMHPWVAFAAALDVSAPHRDNPIETPVRFCIQTRRMTTMAAVAPNERCQRQIESLSDLHLIQLTFLRPDLSESLTEKQIHDHSFQTDS